VGAVTDPLILSQVTDGVILIAKSHKTSREILRRASRQLRDLGAKMLGCVLNDLDLESRRKGYGYPYYSYYKSGYYRSGYYSSDDDKDGKASKGEVPRADGGMGPWPPEYADSAASKRDRKEGA
jgi:Mrp family chromosome partitioning ATPase